MRATRFLPVAAIAGLAFGAAPAHALSPRADVLFQAGPLPVTNSMLTTWVMVLGTILLIRLFAGARPKLIPTRGQSVMEGLVVGLRDFYGAILGPRMIGPVFPMLAGMFVFILLNNWSGMLPGVGSIGWGTEGTNGFQVEQQLIRPANTDLNTTLGMALFGAFGAWLYFCLRYAGLGTLLFDIFGNKADKKETPWLIYLLLFPIFFAVGVIELISIAFRPVSLSLRLYGNMFGGENLLHSMTVFFWPAALPFYFYETLVGVIQAIIFTLLLAIYIGLVCNHGDDHGHGDEHAAEAH